MPLEESNQQNSYSLIDEAINQINILSGARDFAHELAESAIKKIPPGLESQDKVFGKAFRRFFSEIPEEYGYKIFDPNRPRDRKIFGAMITEAQNTHGTLKFLKTIEGKFEINFGFIKKETSVLTVIDLIDRVKTGYQNICEDPNADASSAITESAFRIVEFLGDRCLDGLIIDVAIIVAGNSPYVLPFWLSGVVAKKIITIPAWEFIEGYKEPLTDALRCAVSAASNAIWHYDAQDNTYTGYSEVDGNLKLTFPNPVVQQIIKQMHIKAVFSIPEPQFRTPSIHLNLTRQGNEVTGISPELHVPLYDNSQLIFGLHLNDLGKDPRVGLFTGVETPVGSSQATIGIQGGISQGRSGLTKTGTVNVTHPNWKVSGSFSKNASAWLIGMGISASTPIGMAAVTTLAAISSAAFLIKESRDKRLNIFNFLNYDKECLGNQQQAPRELAEILRKVDEGFLMKTPFTLAIKNQLIQKIEQCDKPEIVDANGQKILHIMKYILQHTDVNPSHDWYTKNNFEPYVKMYTDHINHGIVEIESAVENNNLQAANQKILDLQRIFPHESLFAELYDKMQSKEFLQQHQDRLHCVSVLKEIAKPITQQSWEYIESEIKQLSSPLQLKFSLRVNDHYDALKEEISTEVVNDDNGVFSLKRKDALSLSEIYELKNIEEKQFELNLRLHKTHQASDQIFFKYAENCHNLNKFDDLVNLAKQELAAGTQPDSQLNTERLILCRNLITQMAVGRNDQEQCMVAKIINEKILASAHLSDIQKSDCYLMSGNLDLIAKNYSSAQSNFELAFKSNKTSNEAAVSLANFYCLQEKFYQAEAVLNSLAKTGALEAHLTQRHQDLKDLTHVKTSLFVLAIASRGLNNLLVWLEKIADDSLSNNAASAFKKTRQLEQIITTSSMFYLNYCNTTLTDKIHGHQFSMKDLVSVNSVPMFFSSANVLFGMLAARSKNENSGYHTAKHFTAAAYGLSSSGIAGHHLKTILSNPDSLMIGKIAAVTNVVVPIAMLGNYVFDNLRQNGDAPTSTLGISLEILSQTLGNSITATVALALSCPDQVIAAGSFISTMDPEVLKAILASTYDQIVNYAVMALEAWASLDPWVQLAIGVAVIIATLVGINSYSYHNYVNNGYKKIEHAKHRISNKKYIEAENYLNEAQQCVDGINYYWNGDIEAVRIHKLIKVYRILKDDKSSDKSTALAICDAQIVSEPENKYFRTARSDTLMDLLSKRFTPEEHDKRLLLIQKQEEDVNWLIKNQNKHPETWLKKIVLSEVQAKYVTALNDMQEMKKRVKDHNNEIATFIEKREQYNNAMRAVLSESILTNMIKLIDDKISPLQNEEKRGINYQQEKQDDLRKEINVIEGNRNALKTSRKEASFENPQVLTIFAFESQKILHQLEETSKYLLAHYNLFVSNGGIILKNIDILIKELNQIVGHLRKYNNELPDLTKEQLKVQESKTVTQQVEKLIAKVETEKTTVLNEQKKNVKMILNTFGGHEQFKKEIADNLTESKAQLELIVRNNIHIVNAKQLCEILGHLTVMFQHVANDYTRSVARAEMLPLPKFTESTDPKVLNHVKHKHHFIKTTLQKPLLTLATASTKKNIPLQINTFSKIGVYHAQI